MAEPKSVLAYTHHAVVTMYELDYNVIQLIFRASINYMFPYLIQYWPKHEITIEYYNRLSH